MWYAVSCSCIDSMDTQRIFLGTRKYFQFVLLTWNYLWFLGLILSKWNFIKIFWENAHSITVLVKWNTLFWMKMSKIVSLFAKRTLDCEQFWCIYLWSSNIQLCFANVKQLNITIVDIGVSTPSQKHLPFFLAKPPLNQQAAQDLSPSFLGNPPPIYWFFVTPPP